MPISDRLLRKWRKEALMPFDKRLYETTHGEHLAIAYDNSRKIILKLTQELLDQSLVRKGE